MSQSAAPRAEPSPDSVDAASGPVADDGGIFAEELYLAERRRRRRLRDLPTVLARAVSMAWQASRWGTVSVAMVQVIAAGVSAAQVVLGGWAVSALFGGRGGQDPLGSAFVPLLALAFVTLCGGLVTGGLSQIGRLLGAQVQRAVSGRILDTTTSVELVAFDEPAFHHRLSRIVTNMASRPYDVISCLSALAGGGIGLGAVLVTLLVIEPVLLALLAVVAVPLWFISRRTGRLEFDFAVAQTESFREREYLSELMSDRQNAGELRANSTAAVLRSRYEESYDGFLLSLRKQIRRRYVLQAMTTVSTGVVVIAALVLILILIRRGSISVGEAASAAVAVRLAGSRFGQFFAGLAQLFECSLFLEDFYKFLALPAADVDHARYASTAGGGTRGGLAVHVDAAYFRYPGANSFALQNICLNLAPGDVVAIVGENGSGKTTLAKVLAGLYEQSSGTVSWTGEEGRKLDRLSARLATALVLQDFLRYQFSATDNIVLGRPEKVASERAVVEAARRAGADTFLAALPDGYGTRLTRQFRGGRELSQGQWQRVALARAFYRDAELVIFDEPTAALDPRAEAHLFDTIRRLMRGRTVLLITHRLRSIRAADHIIVMHAGVVAEHGNHAALMARDGLYAELVRLQEAEGDDPGRVYPR